MMTMSSKAVLAACLLLVAAGCTHGIAREHRRVTHLMPIALHAGVNKIDILAPDGRAGMIVVAGEAATNPPKTLYLVMLPDNKGTGWDTVTTGGAEPSLTADGAESAVRFAKAWLDGTPETLLFTATRAAGSATQGPAAYDIAIYRLATGRGGDTPSGFEQVSRTRSDVTYSTADAALQGEAGMP
jgi:hypothetical protein